MSVVSKQASAGDDAFFERLFSKLPSDMATSFNDDQLKVISYAFGTRRWREHAVDLRRIFSLFGRRYYFVLLAGAERRSRRRRLRDRLLYPLMSIGNGIVAVVFFTAILWSVLATLYVLKSLLGISLFEDFSFGVMPMLEQELKFLFD